MLSHYPRYTTISVQDLAGIVRENLTSTIKTIDENMTDYLVSSETTIHDYFEKKLIPYIVANHTSAIAINLMFADNKRVVHNHKVLTLDQTKSMIKDMLIEWTRTIENCVLKVKRSQDRIIISDWDELSNDKMSWECLSQQNQTAHKPEDNNQIEYKPF